MDETDYTVRLAHSSVKRFLIESKSNFNNRAGLHHKKAELLCGEECVNYLSFSDFQLQLQKPTERNMTVNASAPATIMSTLPLSRLVSRFLPSSIQASALRHTRLHTRATRNVSSQTVEEEKYAFLNYARQNWAVHTRRITSLSVAYQQFKGLALQPNNSWALHPWISSGQSRTSHLHGMLLWASREQHLPLLRLVLEQDNIRQFCDIPCVQDGLPALHTASRLGHADVVVLLLTVCDANAVDGRSRTALQYCAEKNHLDVAQKLLGTKNMTGPSQTASRKDALELAARHGHRDMVALLISAGTFQGDLSLVFITAATNAQMSIVEFLAQYFNQSRLDSMGFHSILLAARRGHEKVVKCLLESDIFDVKYRANWVNAALRMACLHRHPTLVKLLLERNDIDINRQNQKGNTPLHMTVGFAQEVGTQFSFEYNYVSVEFEHDSLADGRDNASIYWASKSGQHEVLRLLLERDRINVNVRNMTGATPLQWAVRSGNFAAARLLLKHSETSVQTEDEDDRTPLHPANLWRPAAVVEVLLKHSAGDVNSKDNCGLTPLHLAVASNCALAARLLKSEDIDINSRDYFGNTPLHLAAKYDCALAVKMLLECKDIDVNAKDFLNETALYMAAALGHDEVVDLLIKREDLDVNYEKKRGDTPYTVAVKGGHVAIRRLLSKDFKFQ